MTSYDTPPCVEEEPTVPTAGDNPLFPIVGVGASAGGIEALEVFLREISPDVGAAIVVVMHLDPSRPSLVAEILGRAAQIPVREAVDGIAVERGNVYVIPPNAGLSLEQRRLRVSAAATPRGASIDGFFGSLAEQHGEAAIGIVLSGSGSDGAAGLRAIKGHGGVTMAQVPAEARHDGMPQSAITLGVVDWILPAGEMAAKIDSCASILGASPSPFPLPPSSSTSPTEESNGDLHEVLALVRRKTGQDFAQYKQATMLRRVQRRMRITATGSLAAYAQMLRRTPAEIDRLFGDLLIGVTAFFRDPLVFASLAAEVIPALLRGRDADTEVRFWVPGCATGEEAYSLAILLREALASLDGAPPVKLFATDIDEPALEFARQGRYASSIADNVSPERLARFFRPLPSGYQVAKEIRDMCVFSTHNLVGDPPFSRLDLVSCRNLLIYLEAEIQKKLVPLFHYALAPGGYLVVGPSETLAGYPELFRVADREHRIFQRLDALVAPAAIFPLAGPRRVGRMDRTASATPHPRPAGGEAGVPRAVERLLLDEFAPAAVAVNAHGKILYLSGPTGRYLQPPPGSPRTDLVDMAPPPLRSSLYTTLQRAIRSGKPAEQKGLVLELHGVVRRLDLLVRPMSAAGKEPALFTVVFRETATAEPSAEGSAQPSEPGAELAADLEQELRRTRESLQMTIEELESGSEELQSANEELLSTNEELQSSNEELQTSKEEQQSINEELQTVNVELVRKVEELDRANGDLNNLFASTQIATLFLDRDLRIKRFSPAATELFRFIQGDVGRPVGDIAAAIEDGDLVAGAREVLATLSPSTRQVHRAEGDRWYSRRVRPYRSLENVIEGVVITFVDVTDLKAAQDRLARLGAIVESSQDAIVGIGFDGAITTWNAGAERIYGYGAPEATGMSFAALHPPEVGAALEAGRAEHVVLTDVTGFCKDGRTVDVLLAFSPVRDAAGEVVGVSAIAHDVTSRRRAERALRRSEGRLRWLTESGLISIAFVDRAGRVSEPNDAFLAMIGYTRVEFAGGAMRLDRLVLPEASRTILEEMWARGRCALQELDGVRRDGSRFACLLGGARLDDGAEGVVFLLDVTERRQAAEALRQTEERLRLAIEGTWEVDIVTGVMRCSPRARELWGLAPDGDVIYESRLAHVHPDDRRALDDAMLRALDPSGSGEYRCTYRVLQPGGEARWIEGWGRAVFSTAGGLRRPVRLLGTILDVSERKQNEEALKEVDRRKDRFLAVLGHELRNPLAPIRHAVHIIGKVGADDPAFTRAKVVLDRQARHMAHLLDDLLDVGRIANGRITLRKERMDLVELVRDAVEEHRPSADGAGLTLTARLPERPLWMLADPTRIAQSVANLLVNAVKFTPLGGRVAVTVAAEPDSAVVTVEDDGMGMDPDTIEHLFEPFSQADRSIDRSRGGLGLGLSLVRAFTELHDGSVDARSEGPGRGSEFTLRLPLVADLPPGPPLPVGPARSQRVLVIEDNADAAEVMQITLELAGHQVAVAHTGTDGMNQARAFAPTVVICDIGLPGALDGYAVARALRADPELRSVDLIALSGYAQDDDKRRAAEAGFDDHLTKPVDPEMLERLLAGNSVGIRATLR
jgi:two-component system, chemotaxis family, CheB/CheR fusion protein